MLLKIKPKLHSEAAFSLVHVDQSEMQAKVCSRIIPTYYQQPTCYHSRSTE